MTTRTEASYFVGADEADTSSSTVVSFEAPADATDDQITATESGADPRQLVCAVAAHEFLCRD